MSDESGQKALPLRNENGRKVTAHEWGKKVVITFWRKNDAPLLPLILDTDEAEQLSEMLLAAARAARPNALSPATTRRST